MVNPQYLSSGTLAQVKGAFHSSKGLPSVTLQKFFTEKEYGKLLKAVSKATFKKTDDKMHANCGVAALPKVAAEALNGELCRTYLSSVLGMPVGKIEGELHRFEWKGYTLLHDDRVEQAGVDVILDFTASWNSEAGGRVVYVDGTGDSKTIPSSPNTLSLTLRREGVQKFVQYCNHYAGRKKRLLFFGSVRS